MQQVTFYLLSEQTPQAPLSSHEALACDLAALTWRQGKRVLIACETQAQAYLLDEALWQRHPEQFVPHALADEQLSDTTPVELCWSTQQIRTKRAVLISLLPDKADFAAQFTQVIEFVPCDALLKQQARARYKAYQQAGFHLATAHPPIA